MGRRWKPFSLERQAELRRHRFATESTLKLLDLEKRLIEAGHSQQEIVAELEAARALGNVPKFVELRRAAVRGFTLRGP